MSRALTEKIFHTKLDIPKTANIFEILVYGGVPKQTTAEIGLYKVSGFGNFRIDFLEYHPHPCVLKTSLGYWEVLGIKIPVPLFITKVDNYGMNLLHLLGESYFFFMVVG